MSQASDFLENAIINTYFRGQAATPATPWVALFNGSPTDTGAGGADVTTSIRVAGRVAATFGAPTNGVSTNSALVDFGTVANDTTFTHFGLFDAASGGNLLAWGTIKDALNADVSRTVLAGDGLTFPIGNLSVTVT